MEEGFWSRIPALYSRKSRIPHFFSSLSRNPFFFVQNMYVNKKKLIAVNTNDLRCRLALLIDILNLRVFYGHCKKGKQLFISQFDQPEGKRGKKRRGGERRAGVFPPTLSTPTPTMFFLALFSFRCPLNWTPGTWNSGARELSVAARNNDTKTLDVLIHKSRARITVLFAIS